MRRIPLAAVARTLARSSVRSERKAKGSGHLRRVEILEAAERIFVEYGYEGATIRRIADAVGVSSTALYLHFKDKSEILTEICESAFERVIAADLALADQEMDPVDRVRAMLEVYMRFALAHPHVYQLIFSPATIASGRPREAALDSLGLRAYEIFREAVERAAQAGRLRSGDVDAAAQVAWASAHGVVSLMVGQPRFPWRSAERLMTAATDALFHGIAR